MSVGEVQKAILTLPVLGPLEINIVTWRMLSIVFVLMAIGAFMLGRKIQMVPNRKQAFLEMVIGEFYSMVEGSLGERAKCYYPLIASIFLFVLVSNLVGIIPGMMSPTEDLNVCLSLALVVFIVAHSSGIMKKGLWGYIKGYGEPFIFMAPLNIMGEIGQTLSHCFRLFGNMFGGGVIFTLIPTVVFSTISAFGGKDMSNVVFSQMGLSGGIIYALAAPVIALLYFVAYAFFGLLAGFVQSFVFAMLATTYIAMQVED